eukprot:scaffold26082_cov36-Cyclotella_meneghiniana.AAC.3
MSAIELEMMKLNCNGRKRCLMEILASALNLVSRYVIVVYELDVDHNDFASSSLIKHHEELLKFNATPLGGSLTPTNASTTTEVYDYSFARAAASKEIANDPSHKASNNSQQTPQGQSSLPTPNNLFASGTNKSKNPPSTAQSITSSISSGSTRPNTFIIDGVEYIAKSLISETTISEIPGEAVTLSAGPPGSNGFVKASSLVNNSAQTAKTAAPPAKTPEIVEQFGKSYLSQEYTEEELKEIAELEKAADIAQARAEQENRRRAKCANWALIDSIRAKSSFLDGKPPAVAEENAPEDSPTILPTPPSCLSAKSPSYDTAMTNVISGQPRGVGEKKTSKVLFSNIDDGKVFTAIDNRKTAAEKESSKRKIQTQNDKNQSTLAALAKKYKKLEKQIAHSNKLLKDHRGRPKVPQPNNHGKPPPTSVHKTWVRQPEGGNQEQPVADDANQDCDGGKHPNQGNDGKPRKRYSGKGSVERRTWKGARRPRGPELLWLRAKPILHTVS